MTGLSFMSTIASLRAKRQLDDASSALSKVLERLSSGQRINRAADDAAGLAVASSLSTKRRVYTQGLRNINDGISALNTADAAMSELSGIIERQRELAEQAANGSLSNTQRGSLNSEFQLLGQEYQRIISTTTFNGQHLLDTTRGGGVLNLQAGGSMLPLNVLTATQYATGTGTYSNRFQQSATISANGGFKFLETDFNADGINDLVAVAANGNGAGKTSVYIYTIIGGTFNSFSLVGGETGTNNGNIALLNIAWSGNNLVIGLVDTAATRFGGVATFNSNGSISGYASIPGITVANQGKTSSTSDFNGDGFADRVSVLTLGAGSTITVATQNLNYLTAYRSLAQNSQSISTAADARTALTALETLNDTLLAARGTVGASVSRATPAANLLEVNALNYTAAESRIRDADTAEESARLARMQILQQSSTAVLAQANQQAAITLELLNF